jgi:hypothetical protein
MARPGRPERNRAAPSFRQLRRFHPGINSDKVFGTHTSAWIAGSTTPSDCVAKSPPGNDNEMPPASASNGCSQQTRLAPRWQAPIPPLPKSHNHCDEVLAPRSPSDRSLPPATGPRFCPRAHTTRRFDGWCWRGSWSRRRHRVQTSRASAWPLRLPSCPLARPCAERSRWRPKSRHR